MGKDKKHQEDMHQEGIWERKLRRSEKRKKRDRMKNALRAIKSTSDLLDSDTDIEPDI